MSIASLFDHVCRIWKFSETVTGSHRALVDNYTLGDLEECAMNPASFQAADRGRGNRREGQAVVYLSVDANVARGDVLDVTHGPNAPIKLKVLAVEKPRGHHMECAVEPFSGSLT